MFSLIITIIAIALVAALALATLYYGGSAFNKSASTALATKLISQSQQVLAADALYRVDHEGALPPDMNALVSGGYLKTIPVAQNTDGIITSAQAANIEWQMITTSSGRAYSISGNLIDEATCQEVNNMSYGLNGILKSVYTSLKTQCYGTSASNLVVIAAAEASVLSDPSVPNNPAVKDTPPTSGSDSDWFVPPGASSGGSGSTSGGTTPFTPPTYGAAVAPASLNFGSIPRGRQSSAYSVTYTNTNAVTVYPYLSVTNTDMSGNADFYITQDTCSNGTIAPGGTCTYSVYFSPLSEGAISNSITLQISGEDYNDYSLTQSVSGTGLPMLTTGTVMVFKVTNRPYTVNPSAELSSINNTIISYQGYLESCPSGGMSSPFGYNASYGAGARTLLGTTMLMSGPYYDYLVGPNGGDTIICLPATAAEASAVTQPVGAQIWDNYDINYYTNWSGIASTNASGTVNWVTNTSDYTIVAVKANNKVVTIAAGNIALSTNSGNATVYTPFVDVQDVTGIVGSITVTGGVTPTMGITATMTPIHTNCLTMFNSADKTTGTCPSSGPPPDGV